MKKLMILLVLALGCSCFDDSFRALQDSPGWIAGDSAISGGDWQIMAVDTLDQGVEIWETDTLYPTHFNGVTYYLPKGMTPAQFDSIPSIDDLGPAIIIKPGALDKYAIKPRPQGRWQGLYHKGGP